MAIPDDSGNDRRGAPGPTFPRRNAFVLQFTADSGPHEGRFHGRVQHVASGEQSGFGSLEELWTFLGQVLASKDAIDVPS